jgi:two-component system sensor histidine kinase PilS (NtrC family)
MKRQRAQQLKLASLGRLTASIAHEIRNPLGAISHAGQLLAESPNLDAQDQRLSGIIKEHCGRVNGIIENVMSLSRRETSMPEIFELEHWLETFYQEMTGRLDLASEEVIVRKQVDDAVHVRMDASQLHQVLWNLCENGLRYGRSLPRLILRYGIRDDSQRPYLDVIDSGEGIPEDDIEHIFEPFFTTAGQQGTGLGLYLARELCEGNQASLSLLESTSEGCCFRILFAHPERSQEISL